MPCTALTWLFESVYEPCFAHEMTKAASSSSSSRRPADLTLKFDRGFRVDFVIAVIVEVKSVERLLPVHDAQLLTYMKLTGYGKVCS